MRKLLLFAVLFAAPVHAQKDAQLGRDMEILVNMMRTLHTDYVRQVDADSLMMGAGEGMTAHLDPYTEYLPEERMQEFDLLTTGKYGGVGSLIRKKGDYILFAQPYKGTPSDRAGVRIGDKILAIEGKDAKGWTPAQASAALKGTPGTDVSVVIERLIGGGVDSLTLRRERISIPGVPYWGWVREGIGYIRHGDFTEGAYKEVRAAIEGLRKQGELKGLILDYRSNGGGIMQEAVGIVSLFTPKGTTVVSTQGRTGAPRVYKTEREPVVLGLPVAVLINSSSASATEIVAGALQDHRRATLVGQKSYGKGVVQSTRPIGYNAMLKLTTARYLLPSGRTVTVGEGLKPDVELPPQYISRFAATLLGLGLVEDWVDTYMQAHPNDTIDVRAFRITDADYASFGEFLKDKDIPYESETRRALRVIKKAAENDRYSAVTEQVEQLEQTLKDDVPTNLQTYRREIQETIEAEIVLRHAYQAGVIEHNLPQDEEVQRAAGELGKAVAAKAKK